MIGPEFFLDNGASLCVMIGGMKVPLSWLEEYIELHESPEEIAKVLTISGLEVDAIESASLGFSGVVVGEVVRTEPHPEADRLTVAEVAVGEEKFQVVCGAPNCRAGIKTAFAQVGAKLTAPDGETFKIKKSKLRGVPSHGMLCAGSELGLAGSDGIMELDPTLKTGTSFEELYGDTIFEISLTPNLGHCMSVWGIARELSSLLDRPMKGEEVVFGEAMGPATSDKISVSIEDQAHCFRYCAQYVEGVTVGPSPDWLRSRLEMAGVRSINNIVDVTNYVMLTWGQPLHAFDADKLVGDELIVRSLEEPYTMETLDDVERELPKGTLVIADAEKPVAVAGVMGGKDSAVSNQTQNVVLEGAWFCASSVRRSSKLLSLRSDSSARFERGIDGEAVENAVRYAAQLLTEVAGATAVHTPIDERIKPPQEKKVLLRLERTNAILGTALSFGELEAIVQRMGVTFSVEEGGFFVVIPSWRNDIHEEIDLIEEVARIYGYNLITTDNLRITTSMLPDDPHFVIEEMLRDRFVREGLQEFLCCDLIAPKAAKIGSPEDFLAYVLKPSSVDQSVLRPSLLPGLLDVVKLNSDRGHPSLFGFEIGRIHYRDGEEFVEKPMLGIVMTGSVPGDWASKGREGDFFDIKGVIERALNFITVQEGVYDSSSIDLFHPGRQATISIEDTSVGFIGEVHPDTLDNWDIGKRVYYAHLDIEQLAKLGFRDKIMQPLPLYPGSERDWTVTVDKEVPVAAIIKAIRDIPSRILQKIELIDLYESEKIGLENKNLTFRFSYRDDRKTIAFETVEKEHARILAMLDDIFLKNCLNKSASSANLGTQK